MDARSNEWNQRVSAEGCAHNERDADWPFIGTRDAGHAPPMRNDDRQATAQRIQRFCTIRQDDFGPIIHDASFNLLIDMYLSESRDRRVSVGDACLAARSPQTTALRAIQALIDAGTIQRSDDTRDNRRKLLSLTREGREQITRFIDRFTASGGFQAS